MGSGKSTIGKKLAARLKIYFIDLDDEIEKDHKISIKEMFKYMGETYFRKIESKKIGEVIKNQNPAVISLGGGALINEENLKLVLETGKLIYIQSSPEEIWKRTKHSRRRPLLSPDEDKKSKSQYLNRIQELLKVRNKGYTAAHIKVNRDGLEAEEVTELIYQNLMKNDF